MRPKLEYGVQASTVNRPNNSSSAKETGDLIETFELVKDIIKADHEFFFKSMKTLVGGNMNKFALSIDPD